MKDIKYKRRYDKRVKWITLVSLLLVIVVLGYLYFRSGGSYFPAWVTLLLLASITLIILSIPRFVCISRNSLEIHCVMEITTIPYKNITEVKRIEKKNMKWTVPLPFLGIYGIFGYYGYYINLRTFRIFKIYSKQWNNFIAIEDIYEDIIVVSVDDPEKFISEINLRIKHG